MFSKIREPNLIVRLIIAIILGIGMGQITVIPENVFRSIVTIASGFSTFLNFIIPLMIIAFIVKGVAELTENAGKLLAITAGIAYSSTVCAGMFAFFSSKAIFPSFITNEMVQTLKNQEAILTPYFMIPLSPMLDVTSAVLFSFILGLGISSLRKKGKGQALFEIFSDFNTIILNILERIVIPFLPIYIFSNFLNLSYSGQVFTILIIFGKVFGIILLLHLIYLVFMFSVAGILNKKNPLVYLKNQIPGYLTAIGTQSSAATIPVNLLCAEKNGTSQELRQFVIPLSATIHLAGSMITITSCVTAITLMFELPLSMTTALGFIMILGIAMVAAPGAPGGAIMSALPFLPIVGITAGVMQELAISLYITQDSFGTAANVSGDNALLLIIEKIASRLK
ncbi:cation:dicarboxylate symporter family transporter [Atopobacter phocae]|uniref:cation:dicarboxylate symporter family transporter n=1 Tax=Atopobacter phocae TaxID=136492 RepID=UPI00046EF145|nr:cation:dicarboxylase symporter family transporter [Atopobacter phocae]